MKATKTGNPPAVVLFRQDLRLADNLALTAATSSGNPVVAALVLDEESDGVRPTGAARKWWLHHSIAALARSLEARGVRLILRRGPMVETALALQSETGAAAFFWNRRYGPAEAAADGTMKAALRAAGVRAESFDGQLLHEPTLVKTGSGGFYKVFGAFRRALEAMPEPRDPADAPERLDGWDGKIASDRLEDWSLVPSKPDWAGGLRQIWTPGEVGAAERLEAFVDERIGDYATGRDYADREATSRLSPHLAGGEITPFQILQKLRRVTGQAENVAKLRSELMWREFCHHLLMNARDLATVNFDRSFDGFEWRTDAAGMNAWRKGLTGYPIVDAGMRELWQTGWMHNRVRMVVASFLTKHLLIDWREGERWFWDTLVDADVASNPGNWQWVAGCGADAAPYFRVFNPVLQGEKFDPSGAYVRKYVPELAALPDRFLHKPWKAPTNILDEAGVKLGQTYPVPLVDHDMARNRALSAYRDRKGNA